ncbi:DNA/RNA non-specific endonuclease [Bacteroides heparinolyticus]|uniref:DNA/RNA non-specific endonuclease n=2 Tax=Bacteroidales TaxID=171549 RepID=UPI0035A09575
MCRSFLLLCVAALLVQPVALPCYPQNRKSTPTTLIEQPMPLKGTPEQIIQHTGYILSFNSTTLCPNWVAWELTRSEASGSGRRATDFLADPQVPLRYQVTTEEYKNSGYDRGHMCPAADMKWHPHAQTECFYMSNICPQDRKLNSGSWGTLENACRRWAKREGKVYIVCGPVFKRGRKKVTIGRNMAIRVPDGFFKVVLSTRKGAEKAIGFYYGNHSGKQSMTQTAMSVDEVEDLTGMNFFHRIDDVLEKRVEASYNLKDWH